MFYTVPVATTLIHLPLLGTICSGTTTVEQYSRSTSSNSQSSPVRAKLLLSAAHDPWWGGGANTKWCLSDIPLLFHRLHQQVFSPSVAGFLSPLHVSGVLLWCHGHIWNSYQPQPSTLRPSEVWPNETEQNRWVEMWLRCPLVKFHYFPENVDC